MNFTLYRRHVPSCKHSSMKDTNCKCPVWAYGREENDIVRKSLGTKDWGKASKRLSQLEADPLAFRAAYSVSKAIHEYMATCSTRKLSKGTLSDYGATFKVFMAFCIEEGIDSPNGVTLKHLELWQASRKIAPTTLTKETTHIRMLFKWLRGHQQATVDPGKLSPLNLKPIPTLPLSMDQVRMLMLACKQKRLRALMYVMLYTGLRISDAVQLRKGSVGGDGRLLLRIEKTGDPLYVKLPLEAISSLAQVPDRATTPYYFWTGIGRLGTCTRNNGTALRRLGEHIKIMGVRAHRFRDTFAVNLIESGASPYEVQKLLGHKSIKTTEAHYLPWILKMQGKLDDATSRLPSLGL